MSTARYFAGVDVGSATTKAVVIDGSGAVSGRALMPSGGTLSTAADTTLAHALERVLILLGAQQNTEAGDVLTEDLQHRVVDPLAAETDARALLAHVLAGCPGVDRLLEEGDPGLPPECAAEQHR